MLRRNLSLQVAVLAALALAGGGCSGGMFDKGAGQEWFSQPLDVFHKPDWARTDAGQSNDMDTGGPVASDQLVGPDGRCAAVAAQAPAPQPATATTTQTTQPPANNAVGSMTGELGGEPAPASAATSPVPDANTPPLLGGIALGMTECQAARRAGVPANVSISAGTHGERQVVLTYLSGQWPGIYHFSDGRLKEIDAAPQPEAPAKPAPKKKKIVKKKKPAPAKTSQGSFETVQ